MRRRTGLRWINLGLGLCGLALFLTLFSWVSLKPQAFDRRVVDIAVTEVSDRFPDLVTRAQAEAGDLGALTGLAEQMLGGARDKLAWARSEKMREAVHDFVAALTERRCDLGCTNPEAAGELVLELYDLYLEGLGVQRERLDALVASEMSIVIEELRRDILIFSGSNLGLFLAVVALALLRPAAQRHLAIPTALLTVATLFMTWRYLFGQDWLRTVIFSDYWGYGYLVWVVLLFGVLLDIVVNRGRILSRLMDLLGAALSPIPC